MCNTCGSNCTGPISCSANTYYQNQANQMQAAQNVYPYYPNTTGQSATYNYWSQSGNLGYQDIKIYYSIKDALSENECNNLLLEYKEGRKSLELVQTLWKAALLLGTLDNLKYLELIEQTKEIENVS